MREVTVSRPTTAIPGFAKTHRVALFSLTGVLGLAFAMTPKPLRADAPAGRYLVTGSSVTDTQTGLEWQSNASSSGRSWADATSYCASLADGGSAWRLPSIAEAATLIDESRTNPALDPTAFPNAPVDVFWTSSALSEYSGVYAWTISSANGGITFFTTAQLCRVRCVRSPNAAGD
jgi:hypothetical protein